MKSYEQEIVRIISGKPATNADLEMVTLTNDKDQVDEAAGETHPMALHVKPIKKDGKPMYQVHAVGKKLGGGIKVGEHLSDTELDDATEMGAKIKHMKEDAQVVDEMSSKQKMKLGLYNKKSMKEEDEVVDRTVIEHNAFTVDLPETLTFSDYLNAAKVFVQNEQDAIVVADKFFRENDESIVVESVTKSDIEDRADNWRKAGHKVSLPKYTTKDGKLHAEYTVTDKDTGQKTKYVYHGSRRSVEKS